MYDFPSALHFPLFLCLLVSKHALLIEIIWRYDIYMCMVKIKLSFVFLYTGWFGSFLKSFMLLKSNNVGAVYLRYRAPTL